MLLLCSEVRTLFSLYCYIFNDCSAFDLIWLIKKYLIKTKTLLCLQKIFKSFRYAFVISQNHVTTHHNIR